MTKTTTNLLGIVITILAGTYFFMTYCSECSAANKMGPVKEEIATPAIPEATSYPFAFKAGDYAYNVDDNFNFNVSSSSILMPLSQKVTAGVDSLKAFLTENATKVIDITGYYAGDESNDSAFPNLGLARANAVKNYLVSKEISSTQINTMGKLMGEMVPEDNMYMGPVGYNLGDKAADADDELQALYDKIAADPLVLYFDTAQASIELSTEQRQKVADISRYLDMVEGATVKVVGHSDDEGRRVTNVRLGRERADFARTYLINNGIPDTKIISSSKGPDSPIESNATEEGRSKNRRTVITLNK